MKKTLSFAANSPHTRQSHSDTSRKCSFSLRLTCINHRAEMSRWRHLCRMKLIRRRYIKHYLNRKRTFWTVEFCLWKDLRTTARLFICPLKTEKWLIYSRPKTTTIESTMTARVFLNIKANNPKRKMSIITHKPNWYLETHNQQHQRQPKFTKVINSYN
jgi:hypothetical protein